MGRDGQLLFWLYFEMDSALLVENASLQQVRSLCLHDLRGGNSMKRLRLFAAGIMVAVLIGAAGYNYYRQQETAKLYTGTIEVTKADVTTKSSGYIKELLLSEGMHATKGQLAARIDRKDLLIARERDRAALKKAEAQLRDLESGARPAERKEAAANSAFMQAAFEKAAKDYQRFDQLYQAGAASRQQFDNAKESYDAAAAQLSASREREQLVNDGTREEQLIAAREEVRRCQALLRATENDIEDTSVYSPLDAMVLTKNFEAGEYVNAGSALLTVADLSDCWVKIYIPSTELGRVSVGTLAEVKIDSAPGQAFPGRVREISENAEYTPRQSITRNERANMVFAVKVAVDNDAGVLKPGMPADVSFDD